MSYLLVKDLFCLRYRAIHSILLVLLQELSNIDEIREKKHYFEVTADEIGFFYICKLFTLYRKIVLECPKTHHFSNFSPGSMPPNPTAQVWRFPPQFGAPAPLAGRRGFVDICSIYCLPVVICC